MTTDGAEKARESRLRRMADRNGLRLMKSHRRDPRADDFGTYMLVDVQTGGAVYANWNAWNGVYGLDLDDVESWLHPVAGEC